MPQFFSHALEVRRKSVENRIQLVALRATDTPDSNAIGHAAKGSRKGEERLGCASERDVVFLGCTKLVHLCARLNGSKDQSGFPLRPHSQPSRKERERGPSSMAP